MKLLDKFEKKFGLQSKEESPKYIIYYYYSQSQSSIVINLGPKLRCQISFYISQT